MIKEITVTNKPAKGETAPAIKVRMPIMTLKLIVRARHLRWFDSFSFST